MRTQHEPLRTDCTNFACVISVIVPELVGSNRRGIHVGLEPMALRLHKSMVRRSVCGAVAASPFDTDSLSNEMELPVQQKSLSAIPLFDAHGSDSSKMRLHIAVPTKSSRVAVASCSRNTCSISRAVSPLETYRPHRV